MLKVFLAVVNFMLQTTVVVQDNMPITMAITIMP